MNDSALIKIFKSSSIGSCIYHILNIFILSIFILWCDFNYSSEYTKGSIERILLLAIAIYLTSLLVASSNIGEYIVRSKIGCHKIRDEKIKEYIMPIYEEVYLKASQMDLSMPKNVKLYMNNDLDCEVCAIGRRSMCISRGVLSLSEEEIKAKMAHEFAHIANRDSDAIPKVIVGGFIVSIIMFGIRLAIAIFCVCFAVALKACALLLNIALIVVGAVLTSSDSSDHYDNSDYYDNSDMDSDTGSASIIVELIFFPFSSKYGWTRFGMSMCLESKARCEYIADSFAYKLGYSKGLYMVLSNEYRQGQSDNSFKSVTYKHPANKKRLKKLLIMDKPQKYVDRIILDEEFQKKVVL